MSPEELKAREKIFQATFELVMGGEDADRLTTRQIAAKAGVNPALVNYHYQSKENLIGQVVGTMMDGIISREMRQDVEDTDARGRLLNILTTTADVAFQHYNVCKIAISIELKQGCRNSCDMIRPLLQELFNDRSESDLDIIALQLMLPFHQIVLDPGLYNGYLNTDFFDEQKRRMKIGQMVDCVLAGISKEAGE